ncbi:STAS domain-containing protein [Streptomyces sp. NPDC002886]|uniref:STAS domain-containing protein n=1 Tax=Streptomyces sp. NPDC002886 TaxID=3364667 RepID=UPI0036AEA4D4
MIDHFTAAPLRALRASAADDDYTGLVLDTERVTFADSGFLAVLDWWLRHGHRLRLANRSRAVKQLSPEGHTSGVGARRLAAGRVRRYG